VYCVLASNGIASERSRHRRELRLAWEAPQEMGNPPVSAYPTIGRRARTAGGLFFSVLASAQLYITSHTVAISRFGKYDLILKKRSLACPFLAYSSARDAPTSISYPTYLLSSRGHKSREATPLPGSIVLESYVATCADRARMFVSAFGLRA